MGESLSEIMVKRHNAIMTERKERRRKIMLKRAKTLGYNARWKGKPLFSNPYIDNDYQAAWRKGWTIANEEIYLNARVIEKYYVKNGSR